MNDKGEIDLIDRALAVPQSERILTIRNYLEYICDDIESENAIYIPINTLTPSELEGLTLYQERKLRVYGCEVI